MECLLTLSGVEARKRNGKSVWRLFFRIANGYGGNLPGICGRQSGKIYIYSSFEGGVQSCNFFYKVNGKVVKKSRLNDVIVDGQEEYDVSIPRQRDVMAILNEDMVALRSCVKNIKEKCQHRLN